MDDCIEVLECHALRDLKLEKFWGKRRIIQHTFHYSDKIMLLKLNSRNINHDVERCETIVLFPKSYSDIVKLCPRIFLPLGEGVSLSD